jgi:hypothetical protein
MISAECQSNLIAQGLGPPLSLVDEYGRNSRENRLKSRLAEIQKAGIPIDTGTISRMAQYTEDKWSISMAFQKDKATVLKQSSYIFDLCSLG